MSDLLLPPGTRMIHIGPSKTGSTAIQNAMHRHREVLHQHGVVYASGGGVRAREAGWAVVGGRSPVGRPAPRMEKWHALVREVADAGDLRVVHSNEDYGRATPEEIDTLVAGLGGGRPHVVWVVRRLDGLLPSYWQERVKARETRSFDAWLEVVLAEESADWQWFNVNYPHDVHGAVERWARAVGKDNITLIVADGADPRALPRAFEGLLGLPDQTLELDEAEGNRSLSYNEAEALRRVNIEFRERGWGGETYKDYAQSGMVMGLRSRPVAESDLKLRVPTWAHERVRELAARQADAVRESGVRVIGDPDTLRAVGVASDVDPATLHLDLDTAARMAAGVVERSVRLRERDARKVRRARKSRAAGSPVTARRDGPSVEETGSLDLLRVVARRARARIRRQ